MVPLRQDAQRLEDSAPKGRAPRRVFREPTADARTLQAMAEEAWTTPSEPDVGAKWSSRRSMVFVTVATLVLWAGIFVAGSAILSALG